MMTGQQRIGTVRAVLTGKAVPYTRPGSCSAIAKSVRSAAVRVGPDGLEGDEQGDGRIHGGAGKAVHCYPWAHYRAWRRELPDCGLLARPGATRRRDRAAAARLLASPLSGSAGERDGRVLGEAAGRSALSAVAG